MAELGNNLVDMFGRTVERMGDAPFLWAKRDGTYVARSWRSVADDVRAIANALVHLGLRPGERVLLVSENRPEWCIADLAIMAAGGVTVPAYTTNTVDDHAHLLEDSEASMVVCSGKTLAKRLLPAIGRTRIARMVISLEPLENAASIPASIILWQDALRLGEASRTLPAASAELTRNSLACLIYTSGTGGRPKGVMLSHGNLMANVEGAMDLLERIGLGDDVFLSFLPLSHSYEHTAGQMFPIAIAAQIYYAEGTETVRTNLLEARPTILTCVPRLYEVLRQRISNEVNRQGGLKAKLLFKAIELGRRRIEGQPLSLLDRVIDMILERLVRDKIRARFGGRLKAMVSGGAPLNYDVGMFFLALGLPLLQGYGQTEAAPVISVNTPFKIKLDAVGPPVKGVEVKIAEDGEILVAGAMVMQGYWKDPEGTRHALRDGWLHTGDVGRLDEDGYLKITDRKKDIIVVSGGDNISPQRIEGMLGLRPEIGQAVIFGNGKPYIVALIVPNAEFAKQFARDNNVSAELKTLVQHDGFKKALAEAVAATNTQLSQIERIRRWYLVSEPFTTENGLMTPSLKVRRSMVQARYETQIDDLYG